MTSHSPSPRDVLDLTPDMMIAAVRPSARRARAWIAVERGARFAVIAAATSATLLAFLALTAPARAQTFDGLFDYLASGEGVVVSDADANTSTRAQ